MPSKKELRQEIEKVKKIEECYRFLLENAEEDNVVHKKLEDIRKEHLLSVTDALFYSVELPLQDRLRELDDELKKAKGNNE